jgi:hypothetical protein
MSLLDSYVHGFALRESRSAQLVGHDLSGSNEFHFGLQLVLRGIEQALAHEDDQREGAVGLYGGVVHSGQPL